MHRFSKQLRSKVGNSRAKSIDSKQKLFVALMASVAFSGIPGCKIPDLRLAKCGKSTPASFEETTAVALPGNTGESSAQIPWCEFFQDPELVGLINSALTDNQELRILAEDIRIAQAEVRARRGAIFPFVTAGAGAGIEKSSRFTRFGAVEDQLQVAPGKGFPEPLPNFLLSTNVTWEVDIWRKLRNARDAASYRYLGTREGWNFVVTRLIADVAENYYELLALDNQLQILDKTMEIQTKSLETAEALKDAGRGTQLGVQRFEAEVRKIQSEKLIVQQQIIEVENKINFATGRFPQHVNRQTVDYIQLNINSLSAGVPSQLLQNRADIRQAERELIAAGLDIKVARANFYPSLVMTAGVGYEAFNTKYLFTSPESLIYGAAGELVGPLINRSAIKAEYQTANAKQIQSVYNYQKTVLNAFTEVINFMTAVENYGQSVAIKQQQLEALAKSVEVATNLFQNRQAEYLEVLLAQREYMEANTVLIETKQKQLRAIVNAYQALGGGGAPTRGISPVIVENSVESIAELDAAASKEASKESPEESEAKDEVVHVARR